MVKMESALDKQGCAIVRDFFGLLLKTGEIKIMKAIHQETSHGTASKWTPERIETIKQMRSQGISYSEIAKKFDSTVDKIYGTMYWHNVNYKKRVMQ